MPKNSNHNYFLDREDAAEKLYDVIPKDFFDNREVVVMALSEGGVQIADSIAQKLGATMDILLIESIIAPNNPELSIAKVSETQEIVIHGALIEAFDISEEFVYN
jgi:putative phosphoribosyl transferase